MQTNTYAQIILDAYIHSNRVDSYVDGVTNSLHFMASITSTSITSVADPEGGTWGTCPPLHVLATEFIIL